MQNDELRTKVIAFLNAHRKAVFAILDVEGQPTTSLMLYAIDDDMTVYFGTRRSFSKYQHIIDHPVVSLSVIEEVLDPLKVVDIRGDVTEVPHDELDTVHTFFKTKNNSKYYVEGAEDFTMFKLVPHFVRWLDAESGDLQIIDLNIDAT
ncbi:pyridoxamine 5'-phosphate oxidase family protein [Candidatus Kaiserbacteria bacterium]|nr:pyridoxamine 5'-phosphate oxidase family protein [Candidatus Kaiserbacteria bacterium]